jgi:LCP family protein required for cell wall assembly
MRALRKRKIIYLVLLIIVIGGATTAIAMRFMWNKPLGPGLDLPTLPPSTPSSGESLAPISEIAPTPLEQGSSSSSVITTTQQASSGKPVLPAPSPTATLQPLCGGPRTMTILAIGSDQRGTGYSYGLADSIHIVRIDFSIPNMMIIDFPRDLWVEIPGISDHYGITHAKLNQAYLFGNPGMGYYNGPGEGPGLMARTLDLNFGLRVDHYLAIDTQTFVKMIDAIGGVDIKVDTPIDLSYGFEDPGPELFLSVGTHHLNGEIALILATNRIPSTFQRMKYQKLILGSVREKLLSPDMLPKIPKLVAQFINSVQTDLSPSDINSLICIAQSLKDENTKADSFPQDMFTASNVYDPYRKVTTFIYEVDFDQLRAMISEYMNGIWPMP